MPVAVWRCALQRFRRRAFAPAQLNQGQQLHRLEWVRDEQALGMVHVGLQQRRPEARRRGADKGVRRRCPASGRKQLRLSSNRSGADSCTRSTPRTASATDSTTVSDPSGGSGTSVNRRYARRALSNTLCTCSTALVAGS